MAYTQPSKTPIVKQTEHSSVRGWIIWFLATSFFFYEFCIQVSPNVMVRDLMREFQVNSATVGAAIGSYLLIYAIMQLLVGLLMDRFGPRRLITMATLMCVLGSYIFGTAHNIHTISVGRMLIGLGSAFALLSCFKLTANWFPERRFALISGMVVMVGMLGAIMGESPVARAVGTIGWRGVMMYFAVAGALLSLLLWLIVRDSPKHLTAAYKPEHQVPIFKTLKTVMLNPQIWLASVYGALMYAPTPAFAGLWGGEFIRLNYHFSAEDAAKFVSLIYVGWAIGSPLFGWLSDHLARRKLPLIIGACGGLLVSILLLQPLHLSNAMLGLLLLSLGIFSSGFLPVFSLVRELCPNHITATAIGFANMLNSLGGYLMQVSVGKAIKHHAEIQGLVDSSLYTGEHYRLALTLISVCFGVALILLPFVQETFAKLPNEVDPKDAKKLALAQS